jgi:hypothetical protein
MSEQMKEMLQLRGLDLRRAAADTPDPKTRKLVNMDPFQNPGAIRIRRGSEVIGGPLLDDLVRAIARINGVRYQVAGQRLYRNFTAITGPYLASNKKTAITAFRPLDDSVIWAFVADDDWMMKSDETRLYQWGIEEPMAPDPKVANQTGSVVGDTITEGTYTIAVTQLRYDHTQD